MNKRNAPFTINHFMHRKTENLFSFAIFIFLIFYLTQIVINMEKNGLNHRSFSILTNGNDLQRFWTTKNYANCHVSRISLNGRVCLYLNWNSFWLNSFLGFVLFHKSSSCCLTTVLKYSSLQCFDLTAFFSLLVFGLPQFPNQINSTKIIEEISRDIPGYEYVEHDSSPYRDSCQLPHLHMAINLVTPATLINLCIYFNVLCAIVII